MLHVTSLQILTFEPAHENKSFSTDTDKDTDTDKVTDSDKVTDTVTDKDTDTVTVTDTAGSQLLSKTFEKACPKDQHKQLT